MSGWNNPGWYSVETIFPTLGCRVQYGILLNNAPVLGEKFWDRETFASYSDAQLEAAKRNYRNGSYHRPVQFGLDGVE